MEDRFGDLRAVPALQFLLFETDAETPEDGHRGRRPDVAEQRRRPILLPLRQSADYRRESSSHLNG